MQHKAVLWERNPDNFVQCSLCAHKCVIADRKFGACGMRQNVDGILYTFAYGSVIASHIDPVEKKPLYHFLPGTYTYSIATIGCNFRCGFCQNWTISQLSLRNGDSEGYELKPDEVIREAVRNKCSSISYTYTEPTVFFEYSLDIAAIAKKNGLRNIYVTNGYMTRQAIDMMAPYIDAANIDLKFFDESSYASCGGSLQPVLDSIKHMKEQGIWVEVTTLIIPGMNDSESELRKIAEFIAGVGSDIPWHISRFHPDYKMTGRSATPVETMLAANNIAHEEGLVFVYLGNMPSSRGEETFCHGCGESLILRAGFSILRSENF